MYTKGFTLIELVVVTAIILGVTGIGTVSYLNYNEKQTLEQAALTIKNDLRLVQQNAIARVKNNGACPNKELIGWCFSPDSTTGNNYKMYGSCADPGDFALIAPGIGLPAVPVPNPGSVATFTQYSDEEQVVDLPRGTTFTKVSVDSGFLMGDGTFLQAESEQRVMFMPDGGVYLRAKKDGTITDNQDENGPKELYYCLHGLFPSLGSDTIYRIRVKVGGEIIDDGFRPTCQ